MLQTPTANPQPQWELEVVEVGDNLKLFVQKAAGLNSLQHFL